MHLYLAVCWNAKFQYNLAIVSPAATPFREREVLHTFLPPSQSSITTASGLRNDQREQTLQLGDDHLHHGGRTKQEQLHYCWGSTNEHYKMVITKNNPKH